IIRRTFDPRFEIFFRFDAVLAPLENVGADAKLNDGVTIQTAKLTALEHFTRAPPELAGHAVIDFLGWPAVGSTRWSVSGCAGGFNTLNFIRPFTSDNRSNASPGPDSIHTKLSGLDVSLFAFGNGLPGNLIINFILGRGTDRDG